ncbi:chloride channel protein [Bacteriovoracaceae bacterium]|nr:chloride channel protein [Bacteriovoracaceae bacterium]
MKNWIKDTFHAISVILRNEDSKDRIYFTITMIVGVASGVIAVAIQHLTHTLTVFFRSDTAFSWWTICWGGSAVFISGIITTKYFPSTTGSGIPGVKIALAVYNGRLTIFSTFAKFIASILSLSSGLSLGREGPTVAIAGGVGSYLAQIFRLSKKKTKDLVAIGAAGGLAAAFNTPIAAVIFTLEEVVGDLNAKVLGPIIISSILASVVASVLLGNASTFSGVKYSLGNPKELIFYLFVGVVAALCGVLWVKSVIGIRELVRKRFKDHRLLLIMLSFFFIAALSYIHPDVLGGGHGPIEQAIQSQYIDWKVFLGLFILKFIATTVCYGSGVSGGLFMPTLFMGAMIGGLIGSLTMHFFPFLGPYTGAFSLVGMGAFFASVIRTPFTSIIMIFEMTRDYKIMLPLMIANTVAYFISQRMIKGSIYEIISEQDGVHLPSRDDDEVLESVEIRDIMIKKFKSLDADLTISEAYEKTLEDRYEGYPVLRDGNFIEMVSHHYINNRLLEGGKDDVLGGFCHHEAMEWVYPDQSLFKALHKMKKNARSRIPVVSRINDEKILGIVTIECIVNYLSNVKND